MVLRPATPGFVVTLAATVCLALVSFSTPLLKPIYFLSASINHSGLQGTATFGVLGYCFETGGSKACSNATVGWEFDPNALLSLDLPLNLEIPQVVVKWLTYALVLHIVGLGLAAGASVFGLLAHIREMAMTCFSSCLSGVSAAIVLLAFIFDIVFFIIIRTRVRAVGGTATLGNGIWLTLAAWLMLFFAGFCFGIGRCCFASRPRGPKGGSNQGGYNNGGYNNNNGPNSTGGISHTEAMRLEAIKAENERKARQTEVGLPAFPTGAEHVPLKDPHKTYYEEDSEDEAGHYTPAGVSGAGPQRRGSTATTGTAYTTNLAGRGRQPSFPQQQAYPGGYAPQPNVRAIDQMHNPSPYQQGSTNEYNSNPSASPPPMPQAPQAPTNQYLAAGAAVGHGTRQTSYHSAVSHQGGASQYSQFDQPYGTPGGAPTDPYYTQQNQAPQQSQYPAYSAQRQPSSDPYQQQYNDPYGQAQQSSYSAPVAAAAAAAYSDPYARTRTPPAQPGYQSPYQQQYNNAPSQPAPPLPQASTDYGRTRNPISPVGPRQQMAPWEAANAGPTGSISDIIDQFSSTPAPPAIPPKDVPSEAPPSYDQRPPGAAPPAWANEKR